MPQNKLKTLSNKLFWRLFRDESGQAFTEYILLLALILTFVLTLARVILSGLDKLVLRFKDSFEKLLKTGRAPNDAWSD